MREESTILTAPRRQFIHDRLQRDGEIRFADIRAEFPEAAHRASIHADVAAMRRSGIPVTIVGAKKGRKLILESSRKYTKKTHREGWQTTEKGKIGQVAGSLIYGNSERMSLPRIDSDKEEGTSEVHFNVTAADILHSLTKSQNALNGNSGLSEAYSTLEEKLRRYWFSHDKALAIDSGTTTDHVADTIMHYDFTESESLNNITLFTNSRSIFMKTGLPECRIRTIIIGGRQRHQTESICGELAKRCLDAWDVNFGMAIVGATGIDTSTLMLGSYNDEEAAMKRELLARANIRVIVADSTKFSKYSFHTSSRFARIHPSSIDLIITDSRPALEAIRPAIEGRKLPPSLPVSTDALQNLIPVPILIADEIIGAGKD